MTKRIGIFGGSFNPIHIGHAIIGSTIMRQQLVDQLWFMVTPENPFKQGQNMAAEHHRLRMTELVSRHIPNSVTSAFEMQLPRPSYTIDTLKALQQRFPNCEFQLIIGADNWANWQKWKSPEEIVKRFNVLIYPRLGYEITIPLELCERVQKLEAPIIEISSTEIRDMISKGHSAAFYTTAQVNEYIIKNNLYRD